MNEKQTGLVQYRAKDGIEIKLDFEVVKKHLVRGNPQYVTSQEIIFFLGICKSRGLNPFAMDCYLIKYSQNDNAAIIVSRDHYRARARQQPDCLGWKNGVIIRKNGLLEYREGHLVLDDEELVGGWFEARPKGWDEPKRHTVPLKAYIKKTKDGRVTQFWQEDKQPMMIEKIAEAQGLRALWSQEFGHLYLEEELSEAITPGAIMQTREEPVKADPVADINKEIETRSITDTFWSLKKPGFRSQFDSFLKAYDSWPVEVQAKFDQKCEQMNNLYPDEGFLPPWKQEKPPQSVEEPPPPDTTQEEKTQATETKSESGEEITTDSVYEEPVVMVHCYRCRKRKPEEDMLDYIRDGETLFWCGCKSKE